MMMKTPKKLEIEDNFDRKYQDKVLEKEKGPQTAEQKEAHW